MTLTGSLSLIALCLPGWLWCNRLLSNQDLEKIGLSFLLGSILFTLSLSIFGLVWGLPVNLLIGWLVILFLTITGLLLNIGISPKLAFTRFSSNWTRKQLLLAGILIFIALSGLITSHWYPVSDWDAVSLFDYRAKIILHTGYLNNIRDRASLAAYPPLTSLLHWWVYANGQSSAMPLYQLFYIFYIFATFALLLRFHNRTLALAGALLMAGLPKVFTQSFVAYSNLPYTIYIILGAVYLYFYSRNHRFADLIIGLVLSLASFWARGFPFAAVNILAAFWLLKIPVKFKYLVFTSAIIALGWFIAGHIGIFNRLSAAADFIKWGIIGYYFPYFVLFLSGSYISFRRGNSTPSFWQVLISGYLIALLFGISYYSLMDPVWLKQTDAIQRLFMFINPAIVWFIIDLLTNSSDPNFDETLF